MINKIARIFFLVCLCQFAYGQNNLIRNGGFENGNNNKPIHGSELRFASHWNRDYREPLRDDRTTPDWFKIEPGKAQGKETCEDIGEGYWMLTNPLFNNAPLIPAHSGIAYAGITRWDAGTTGESLQQKLENNMVSASYRVSFWYYIPCFDGRYEYKLSLYLSNRAHQMDYRAFTVILPSTYTGSWEYYSIDFFLPQHRKYNWFNLMNEGTAGPVMNSPDAAYLHIDDLSLTKITGCPNCMPSGAISYNEKLLPQFTPNGDGFHDKFCLRNINNVTDYKFVVKDRWGFDVYTEENFNPNGFWNKEVCWDGRYPNGNMGDPQMYYGTMRLFNCSTSRPHSSYEFFLPIYLFMGEIDTVITPYIPQTHGEPVAPFAVQDRWLYGGPYNGTQEFRACRTIYAGDVGSDPIPYFTTGPNGHIDFKAGQNIVLLPGFSVPPSQYSATIDPNIECCPQLYYRLAPPDTTEDDEEIEDSTVILPSMAIETKILEQNTTPKNWKPTELKLIIYPNPADNFLTIESHMPDQGNLEITVLNSFGNVVINDTKEDIALSCKRETTISIEHLAAGTYFVKMNFDGEIQVRKFVKARN